MSKRILLIDDDDLVLRRCGQESNLFFEFADLLDTAIRSAINLYEIKRRAGSDCQARLAGIAGILGRAIFTVDGLGHDPRQGSLTNATDAGKKDRMGHPITQDTVLQGLDHRALANDLIKGLGTGFSGKDQIRHGFFRRTTGLFYCCGNEPR